MRFKPIPLPGWLGVAGVATGVAAGWLPGPNGLWLVLSFAMIGGAFFWNSMREVR